MPHSEIRLLLCDFDGVISPGSTEALCDACYRVIRQYRPLPEPVFRQLFRTLVPFPLQHSLHFLLESMGLGSHRGELLHALLGVGHGPLVHQALLRIASSRGLIFGCSLPPMVRIPSSPPCALNSAVSGYWPMGASPRSILWTLPLC